MFKKDYKLKVKKTIDTNTQYFVSFKDYHGVLQEIEISQKVYSEFLESQRSEKRQQNFFDRHIEQRKLSKEMLNERSITPVIGIEEMFFARESAEILKKALKSLTKTQRRRLLLYYEHGLTYKQIAEIEEKHFTSIKESIKQAKEKIKKFF